MRTTLTLDDDLADALKERAQLQRRPFKQVVNEALRRGLSQAAKEERPAFRLKPLPGGFLPGIDPLKIKESDAELELQELMTKLSG